MKAVHILLHGLMRRTCEECRADFISTLSKGEWILGRVAISIFKAGKHCIHVCICVSV